MIRIIGGVHKNRPLETVPGDKTRPTRARVRKALFDIARDITGRRVLDLFAGTGAISLEALSRGAAEAVAIESAKPALKTIRANATALGLGDRLTVVGADVLKALAQPAPPWAKAGPFGLIYADPPYAFAQWDELCRLARPFLANDGLLAVEHGEGVMPVPVTAHRDADARRARHRGRSVPLRYVSTEGPKRNEADAPGEQLPVPELPLSSPRDYKYGGSVISVMKPLFAVRTPDQGVEDP